MAVTGTGRCGPVRSVRTALFDARIGRLVGVDHELAAEEGTSRAGYAIGAVLLAVGLLPLAFIWLA